MAAPAAATKIVAPIAIPTMAPVDRPDPLDKQEALPLRL